VRRSALNTLAAPAAIAPAEESPRRRYLAWVAAGLAVFALALGARALWAGYADANPTDGRFDDSLFYHYAARSVAEGRGYVSFLSGDSTALFPPGYPFFLGGLYKAFGPDPQSGETANVILGAATCVLAFALGGLLLGWRVGLAAGLILALFPGQALFVPALMSEVLFTFLFVAALLLAVLAARRRARRRALLVAATGLTAGVAALVRGEALFVPLMILPFWALAWADWRAALKGGALVVVGMAAIVLPWSVRNYLVMDSPILLSSNIGGNFLMGRYAGTMERAAAIDKLQAPYLGLSPKEIEVKTNSLGWREGLKLALTKPWREVLMAGPKLKALYDRDDDFLAHVEGFLSGRRLDEPLRTILQWVANGYYFAVLGLAGVGAVAGWSRRRPAVVLLAWTVALWTVNETLMIADSRYHLPLIPVFTVLAAYGLVTVAAAARQRAVRARAGRGALSFSGD
jgi:4-amino-4-deoxy-L-arabinose transferase-like glycosyltransferase